MAFDAILNEVEPLNLAGDRIEGLAERHPPCRKHSYPSRVMFALLRRYWRAGGDKAAGPGWPHFAS